MRIEDVKWEDSKGLEEFIVWGLIPLKTLVYYLNEGSRESDAQEERVEALSKRGRSWMKN